MVKQIDLDLGDGRILRAYDTGTGDLPVFWCHGTPGTGAPPEPLLPAAAERGVRWVSYDRPGFGGSTARPGRNVAAAAEDLAAVADAFGLDRFAVFGVSGGGPHALAGAALLPDRVFATVTFATLAPFDGAGLDWFAGMGRSGAAEMRSATLGRDVIARHLTTSAFDETSFNPADQAMLAGPWSWLAVSAVEGLANGPGGAADDDIAFVTPWGFEPERITSPLLLVHGIGDRLVPVAHSEWLAARCGSAELWRGDGDGHVSVLGRAEDALDWIRDHRRPDRVHRGHAE